MRRDSRLSGFTLVEVLLAVGITAIVMLMVTSTFRVTLEARDLIEELSESTEAGPRILNLIERDLRGLWTLNVRNNAVLRGRNMDVGSFEADRIDFITSTDAAGFVLDSNNRQVRPSICEVGYWLKPHPRYRELIELWRREDPMVDDDLLTGGSFQLVHDRLKSFKITYYKSLGYEAEEFHEWDSSVEDTLPRRIRIEFTLERKRGSRNVVGSAEIQDFEGAEKTYVRHIVFDRRYQEILRAGVSALIPVLPPPPEDEAAAGGPGGPGVGEAGEGAVASGAGAGRGMADGGKPDGAVQGPATEGNRPPRGGNRPQGQGPRTGTPPGLPPGFPPGGQGSGGPINIEELLRGGGSGGGLGGLFGGQGGGRR